MALNIVRGFRRIGWLLIFPLAALIVLAFYDNAKEFSPANYEAATFKGNILDRIAAEPKRLIFEMPKEIGGKAYFPAEVPQSVAKTILSHFVQTHAFTKVPRGGSLVETGAGSIYLSDANGHLVGEVLPWEFTVHKEASRLKLGVLIIGAFACAVLVMQGSISILAWVLRGFKGSQ